MTRLDVRIALFLVRAARMGHCPTDRWSNLLSIFPERTRRMVSRARAPFGFALGELGVASARLVSHGFGASLPIADNGTAEGRARNRRVCFLVMPEVSSMLLPVPP